jgi:hypothetical protein
MITFDELNTQNHKITELSNVLLYLFNDRSMCDTETACSLFFNYIEKVKDHLGVVDHLYASLLTDDDEKVNNVARLFMSGEQEIKKIVTQYVKKWCNRNKHELVISDYDQFLEDTREIFEFVLSRIQDETENLYPLVREIRGDSKHAA